MINCDKNCPKGYVGGIPDVAGSDCLKCLRRQLQSAESALVDICYKAMGGNHDLDDYLEVAERIVGDRSND